MKPQILVKLLVIFVIGIAFACLVAFFIFHNR